MDCCSLVKCPSCRMIVANAVGSHVIASWAKRAYVGHRLLSVECEKCGCKWQPGRSAIFRAICADYVDLFCPTCHRRKLAQVAADHVLLSHAGRTIVLADLQLVQCDRCKLAYDFKRATDDMTALPGLVRASV